MNCPIVIDKTLHLKVEFVANYLNSEIVDDPPKTGSFITISNEMLTFNSYLDDELRSLNIDFLSGPIGWRLNSCLLYTSPSPRDLSTSRMPSSA